MALRDRWSCDYCEQTSETPVTEDESRTSEIPLCGSTVENTERMRNGNWVRTQVHTSHGEMSYMGRFEDNPFAEDISGEPDGEVYEDV
jgi:hypothetical protein